MTRAFSDRLNDALIVAALVHAEQVRKGTVIPYLTHPVQVAVVLERYGLPEDVVVAGLLHDVLEDLEPGSAALQARIGGTFPELQLPEHELPDEEFTARVTGLLTARFGASVMALVQFMTEQKESGGRRIPWMDRKRDTLARLATATPEEAALKAADALHNVHSIAIDLRARGLTVMDRFRASPVDSMWYYTNVARAVRSRRPPGDALSSELSLAVDDLLTTLEALLQGGLTRLRAELREEPRETDG
jgi:(p)ppGpp synthase/HD superfamily hydrolase